MHSYADIGKEPQVFEINVSKVPRLMKNAIPEIEEKPCTCPPILIVDDNAYNIYSLKLLL